MAGALVEVWTATSTTFVETDDAGSWNVPAMRASAYELRASAHGYALSRAVADVFVDGETSGYVATDRSWGLVSSRWTDPSYVCFFGEPMVSRLHDRRPALLAALLPISSVRDRTGVTGRRSGSRVAGRNVTRGETFVREVPPEMFDFIESLYEAPAAAELEGAVLRVTDE